MRVLVCEPTRASLKGRGQCISGDGCLYPHTVLCFTDAEGFRHISATGVAEHRACYPAKQRNQQSSERMPLKKASIPMLCCVMLLLCNSSCKRTLQWGGRVKLHCLCCWTAGGLSNSTVIHMLGLFLAVFI